MRIPPVSLLRLRRAFRRGDLHRVVLEGDPVARPLVDDPGAERELIEVALLVGIAHATLEHTADALPYLEFGVDRADARRRRLEARTAPSPPAEPLTPAGPPARPPGPPPGPFGFDDPGNGATGPWAVPEPARVPRRVVARGPLADAGALTIVELRIRRGELGEAERWLPALVEPDRHPATRFAATRAQAAIVAASGDHERAHHFLNTAAGLAERVPSRFRSALVECDRAVLLGRQHRSFEAMAIADRLLGRLVRPPIGDYQVWARTEGALLALTLTRQAAAVGDELTARRLLHVGTDAAIGLASHWVQGHEHLAAAAVGALQRDAAAAEADLFAAARAFDGAGYRPAAALVVLEQARLAHGRNLAASARPLYERALAELRAVGSIADARDAKASLDALDAGRPPVLVAPDPWRAAAARR